MRGPVGQSMKGGPSSWKTARNGGRLEEKMSDQELLNDRLIHAARSGDEQAVARALAEGADALAGDRGDAEPRAGAKDSAALRRAAEGGHLECVKILMAVSDPLAHDSYALQLAAREGHAECVRLLIPVSDPWANDSYALQLAAERGHAECVRLLIPVSDSLANDSYALQWAAETGHVECVELLIPVSGPLANDSWALSLAAGGGHAECVKLLLPVSDPLARECRALRKALITGHGGCVDLLLPSVDSQERASAVASKLREGGFNDEASRVESFAQANALEQEVSLGARSARKRQVL
jgi:ankyrin repeat protein